MSSFLILKFTRISLGNGPIIVVVFVKTAYSGNERGRFEQTCFLSRLQVQPNRNVAGSHFQRLFNSNVFISAWGKCYICISKNPPTIFNRQAAIKPLMVSPSASVALRFIVLLLHPSPLVSHLVIPVTVTSGPPEHGGDGEAEEEGGWVGLFSRLHYGRRDLGAPRFSRLSQLPSTLSHEFPLSCLVGSSQQRPRLHLLATRLRLEIV